jgi:hypothetical protein
MTEITYKYSEDKILDEVEKYIEATYNSHYSKSKKYQSIDGIFASGNGRGFCIGNIQKYADRLYSKGTVADARIDLIKIIHYAILAIHDHDQLYSANSVKPNPQSPTIADPPGILGGPTTWPPSQHPSWGPPMPPRPDILPNAGRFVPSDPMVMAWNGTAIATTTGAASVPNTVNYSNTTIHHELPNWRSMTRWDDGAHHVVED